MADFALYTKNLTVGYAPESPLFQNLNLGLKSGELVCFMGSNGIGKSTMIRTLAGIQKPLTGEVIGTGNKRLTVVLTDKVNPGMMTVRDLVTYGRYPYLDWSIRLTTTDEHIINNAIHQVGLVDLQHKLIFELSDGQMQMVMIARALAQDTPVLLLDEPTAHLDLNNRVEIMNLLRKLARNQQRAVLVSTHELDLALQTADLIWLATPEKSICTGIPEDLVLDGTFDNVFQFKGFDLKTGKVKHEAFRNTPIQLEGNGPAFLWTKNALERNGFEVRESSETRINITDSSTLVWKVALGSHSYECKSLSDVLNKLAVRG